MDGGKNLLTLDHISSLQMGYARREDEQESREEVLFLCIEKA